MHSFGMKRERGRRTHSDCLGKIALKFRRFTCVEAETAVHDELVETPADVLLTVLLHHRHPGSACVGGVSGFDSANTSEAETLTGEAILRRD